MAKWNSSITIEQLKAKFKTLPESVGKEVLERTKARTPVDTGLLRDSWSMVVKPTSVTVGNTQSYAPFVEFGTSDTRPVGMLGSTVQEVPDIVNNILKG